jgi:hypothetical protein
MEIEAHKVINLLTNSLSPLNTGLSLWSSSNSYLRFRAEGPKTFRAADEDVRPHRAPPMTVRDD